MYVILIKKVSKVSLIKSIDIKKIVIYKIF